MMILFPPYAWRRAARRAERMNANRDHEIHERDESLVTHAQKWFSSVSCISWFHSVLLWLRLCRAVYSAAQRS